MMSIGAALTTAALRLGPVLPAEQREPARTIREAEEVPETSAEEAALLVAVEAGLREAGYLAN